MEYHRQNGAGAHEGGTAAGLRLAAVGNAAEQGQHKQGQDVIQRHDNAGGGLAQAELAGQRHGDGHIVDLPESADQEEGKADEKGAFVIELHRDSSVHMDRGDGYRHYRPEAGKSPALSDPLGPVSGSRPEKSLKKADFS